MLKVLAPDNYALRMIGVVADDYAPTPVLDVVSLQPARAFEG